MLTSNSKGPTEKSRILNKNFCFLFFADAMFRSMKLNFPGHWDLANQVENYVDFRNGSYFVRETFPFTIMARTDEVTPCKPQVNTVGGRKLLTMNTLHISFAYGIDSHISSYVSVFLLRYQLVFLYKY